MTLSVWQRTIVNTAGDVLGSASVTVRRESDNALATLYDNPAGTGSPLTNPLIADSVGFVRFYTANDRYNITATSGSFTATWRHVQLGTAQSVDADQDLQTTDSVEFAALTVDDVTIDANTISTATGEDLTLSPAGDLIVSSNVTVTGDLTLSGDVAFTGSLEVDNLRLDGSTISSTTTGDNLTLSPLSGVAEVDGDLLPGTDGTYDLGSPTVEWQNLYIDGIASIDSLVADTADINGGTIDNAVIGGSVAAAGTFTSVDSDYIDLATSTSPVPADAVGRLRWDQDEAGGTLMLGMSGGNVVQPVGEAQYYWVKASSAITKGQVIMASGVVGVSGKIEGAPATGLDKDTGIRVIGIAAESIALGEWGLVTSFGYVRGVNTNAFNANDILYLNPSVAGGLTNAMPAAPNPKVIVALVVVKDSTNGELLVRVSHGQTFGSFATDAQITSPSGNDFLVYDGSNSRWENYTAANARTAMGLGTIATQDANNVNIDGGSIDGTTIGASTRAAGNFTTLNANGNVTLGDASTDTVTVNGYMGVGGAPNGAYGVAVRGAAQSGTTQYAFYSNYTGSTTGTNQLVSFLSGLIVPDSAYTVNLVAGLYSANATKGAAATINSQHGLYIADQTAGTNNYGITSLVSSGSNKWNIYASGTAANYFAGNVLVGATTASVASRFSVIGGVGGACASFEDSDLFNRPVRFTNTVGGTSFDVKVGTGATILETNGAQPILLSPNDTERFRAGTTEAVFNEPGNDYDFRVESDTNTHALFVRGSDGKVGIGTSSPSGTLTVAGSAVFNENGADENFRIESDTNTHAFFVDGGNSRVGINNSTPSEALEVSGNIKTTAPTGGTAAAWKLGTVATVSPTSPNRTIEVEINGTIYYLAAKTTNN